MCQYDKCRRGMANIARVSVYLSRNTSEECRKHTAIPSSFSWWLWLQESETSTASGLCLLNSHTFDLGKSFTLAVMPKSLVFSSFLVMKQHQSISKSSKGSLFHSCLCSTKTSGQVCVRALLKTLQMKRLFSASEDELIPELYTVSTPFLSHPMFVFVDSMRAHYHLTESASSRSTWMDPISVLTVQKFLGCAVICEHTYVISPASASWFSHAEHSPVFRCFITGDRTGDLLLL